jgi:hypothetical protein
MATIAAAYPFIEVSIDTSGLRPTAQRSPGVVAVVGATPEGPAGGTAPVNTPLAVDTLDQAAALFATVRPDHTVAATPLYSSLALAGLQDPAPSKIYGVRAVGTNYAAALASLEAADDVTFVSLANVVDVGEAGGADPATGLTALKDHVETMSREGQKRLGVAMIDPATAKSPTYATEVATAAAALKSDSSRMVLIAARGASGDIATAAMAAMAGYPPQASIVLKRIRGVRIPTASQYSPSEIKALSEEQIIPVIDPAFIPGESLHFAEGRCFTTDENLLYVDAVRFLDDLDFRLKAGLIGAVGDARITRGGLTSVQTLVEGILGPLQRNGALDGFSISIPVLDVLSLAESARTPTDNELVRLARQNRAVEILLSVTYGPAVHRLRVTLAPKF